MKYVMAISILLILVVGCTPSANTVSTEPQTPFAVDNKSTKMPPIAAPLGGNITTPVVVTKSTQDIDYNIANAIKSTVLIFSNGHYEMDVAKDVFWYEISMLRPILSGINPPPHWLQNKNSRTWRQGSGVLIDNNGYILTNRNIIEDCTFPCGNSFGTVGWDAQLIYVFVPDEDGSVNIERGREYIATVICKHAQDDLAVIKITPRDVALPCIPIGDSDLVKRSQKVSILGYPSDILYAESLSAYKWKSEVVPKIRTGS